MAIYTFIAFMMCDVPLRGGYKVVAIQKDKSDLRKDFLEHSED